MVSQHFEGRKRYFLARLNSPIVPAKLHVVDGGEAADFRLILADFGWRKDNRARGCESVVTDHCSPPIRPPNVQPGHGGAPLYG